MSIQEKNELLTALLSVMPDARVKHFGNLVKAAENNPLGLKINEVIQLTRAGVVKIKI